MRKYYSPYKLIPLVSLAISIMAFQSIAMEQDDLVIHPMDAPNGVHVLKTMGGFGSNQTRVQVAFSNLFRYAAEKGIEYLLVPKFGQKIDTKEFFTIASDAFRVSDAEDPILESHQPLKLIFISFEPEVAKLIQESLKDFEARFEHLKDRIIVKQNNICDILYALHEDTGAFKEKAAVFTPGNGILFSNIAKTLSQLGKTQCPTKILLDKLIVPGTGIFDASTVGSAQAPSLILEIARRLAQPDAVLMNSWPYVVLSVDFLSIEAKNIASKHLAFLSEFQRYDEYAVPLKDLRKLMQYLEVSEATQQVPNLVHVVLASNELKSNQEKYRALSNIMQNETVDIRRNFSYRHLNDHDSAILDSFRDPITQNLFKAPIRTPFGHSYEKDIIELWVQHAKCDPLSGETLSMTDLVENIALKEAIKAYADLNDPSNIELVAIEGALSQLGLLNIMDYNLVAYLQAQEQKTEALISIGIERVGLEHVHFQIKKALSDLPKPTDPGIPIFKTEFSRFVTK